VVSRGAVSLCIAAALLFGGFARGQEQDDPYDLADRIDWVEAQLTWGSIEAVAVIVREGPGLEGVPLGEPTRDGDVWVRREVDGELALTIRAGAHEEAIARDVILAFRNEGEQQRLLDVSCSVPAPLRGAGWWDGHEVREPAAAEFPRFALALRAPISAAWGMDPDMFASDLRGVALALDPHCLLSVFATGAEAGEGGLQLSFRTRIVVDPGQTVTLPLVQYAFDGHFRERGAVQRWYEIFPDMFTVTPGTRPSLIGGGGYLFSRALTRELQWEEARRFGMGWEWAYCPAQTPGDWYADERFYDPEKGYAGDVDRHRNTVTGSLEDYRRDLRERFHDGWWRTNIAYYLLPHAADLSILEQFADGAIIGADGEPTKIKVGWIKPDSENRMTYPWGNS